MTLNRRAFSAAALAGLTLPAATLRAQEAFPNKPLRIVCPSRRAAAPTSSPAWRPTC